MQITIDGSREQHNKRRIHYQVGNSFDKILENIGMALLCGIRISIRINTDLENFGTLHELQQLFDELGYTNNENFSFYSALLQNYEQINNMIENSSFEYTGQKQYMYKHKHENFKFKCQDHNLFNKIYGAIKNNKLLNFKSIYCAAQSGEYIFDPYGNIY